MIRQLARYQIRPEAQEKVRAAIHKFLAAIRANQLGTLRYDVLQEKDDPTKFVHSFVFRDREAAHAHSEAPETKAFAAVLYPECVRPVEFIDYQLIASNVDLADEARPAAEAVSAFLH